MKPELKHFSLDSMEQAYRQGLVSDSDLDEFLAAWNATPGRFTFAYWQSGRIRQRENI